MQGSESSGKGPRSGWPVAGAWGCVGEWPERERKVTYPLLGTEPVTLSGQRASQGSQGSTDDSLRKAVFVDIRAHKCTRQVSRKHFNGRLKGE